MNDRDLIIFSIVVVLAFVYLIWFTMREFFLMSKNKYEDSPTKNNLTGDKPQE